MNIVVCIKQTPATADVEIDPKTGTLNRDNMESAINPFDEYAVQEAVNIKSRIKGSSIYALTMGPPKASQVLLDAISFGCDQGIHLSDRAFAGADTYATSYALYMGIRKIESIIQKKIDLVICGKQTNDGDTGHVGPGIAAWIDIPGVAYVNKLIDISEGFVTVSRMMEDGADILKLKMPALVSVLKEITHVKPPTLRGKMRARASKISVFNADDIGADKSKIGLSGSPTIVASSYRVKQRSGGVELRGEDAMVKSRKLIIKLNELGLL